MYSYWRTCNNDIIIVIKAEQVSYDDMEDSTYIFPDEDDDLTNYTSRSAQVMVPNGLLQAIGKYSMKEKYTVILHTSVV